MRFIVFMFISNHLFYVQNKPCGFVDFNYHNLGLASTLICKFGFYFIFMIYYLLSYEKWNYSNVPCNNCNGFQHLDFIFSQNSFHYFKDYLMMKLTLVEGIKYLLATSNLVIKLENLDLELDNQNNYWEK